MDTVRSFHWPLFKFLLQTAEKELSDADPLWRHKSAASPKRVSESPRATFKKWRKNHSLKDNSAPISKPVSPQHTAPIRTESSTPDKRDDDMSFLKFLAINALDLSAPATDILLKNRAGTASDWFQLSGHPDSLAPAGPGTVWKKRSACPGDTERRVYEAISSDASIRDIAPRYYREVEYQGERFIELQDLLHGFQDPYVMDIKMGTRTFLESEVLKSTPRSDLYAKMVAIDPAAPTTDEHELGGVTKLRYMQFREQQSSTCRHGFRIEAMKCRGSAPVTDLKTVRSRDSVASTLRAFLEPASMLGADSGDLTGRIVQRLKDMRSKIEQSEYFAKHEVIGSSVFLIYDDTKIGVWLIDFAKTNELPDGHVVDHRRDWVQGNHEEGLLFGFDQLINIIDGIKTSMSSRSNNSAMSKPIPTVSVKS